MTEMGARSRPSADYEVVTADNEIDAHPEVGKRSTKVVRDPLLTFGPGQRGSWSQIVANVILGEDLVREVGVPSIPHLLVEARISALFSTDTSHSTLRGSEVAAIIWPSRVA